MKLYLEHWETFSLFLISLYRILNVSHFEMLKQNTEKVKTWVTQKYWASESKIMLYQVKHWKSWSQFCQKIWDRLLSLTFQKFLNISESIYWDIFSFFKVLYNFHIAFFLITLAEVVFSKWPHVCTCCVTTRVWDTWTRTKQLINMFTSSGWCLTVS